MLKSQTILSLFIGIIIATSASAQIKAERCSEDDYYDAIEKSVVYCECVSSKNAVFSPSDSIRIDRLLRKHYLIEEGYDGSDWDLWVGKKYKIDCYNRYVVSCGAESISGGIVVDDRTFFFDTRFHLLGSITGGWPEYDCCFHNIATKRVPEGEGLPVIYIYRWDDRNALPVMVGQFAPKDFVVEEYSFQLYSKVLYLRGYELVNELYKGDTAYMRLSFE